MADAFTHFGGIDFSGAREPLANLWSAVGVEENGKLRITSVRPHAFRADLGGFVLEGWKNAGGRSPERNPGEERILWGANFPFGLPAAFRTATGAGQSWLKVLEWVADRPADEVRQHAGDAARATRATDTSGVLAPLDLRLYKQTVEGFRWLQQLREEGEVSIVPTAPSSAPVTLIEVHPSATVIDLGLPRRRAPARPGEIRARAAALRPFMEFASPECESLVVTLEDAWDAAIACLTAWHCRDDLGQPFRSGRAGRTEVEHEGWIYRAPMAIS
ncbi:MAG: DUF429 domain-containing protein [Gemmatimonadota bacterium]|jgi:hypothetical protein|nr:DUF429 domain-containing protein [Gemmatimonadota bacterium]